MDCFFEQNGMLDFSKIPPNAEIQDSIVKCIENIQSHEKIMCSVSGGYDSDLVVDLLLRCGGKEKTTFVFNDTGLEYDATKHHLRYLEERYGIEVKTLTPKLAIPNSCKKYGVPFWSKYVSGMIYRLQKHEFQWEDEPLDSLLLKYPRCRSALRWWCNDFKTQSGRMSKFNIGYAPYLKKFLIEHKPQIKISAHCCEDAKKSPAHKELAIGGYDLNITGIRKAEGGARSSTYKSCYDTVMDGPDNYRPIFWWKNEEKELYREWFQIRRSDCYEVWGMDRTGCAGCPFGKGFEKELQLIERYEPKRRKAMEAVFGESYALTREYLKFRVRQKDQSKQESGGNRENASE